MPKVNVTRSTTINATTQKVYETISNFHNWKPWSPWLVQEPECTLNVREDGKYHEWEGQRIGAGNMTMGKENPPHGFEAELQFLKPWKSTSKVRFDLKPEGDDTKVSWSMDSSLPFFMFWMKKMMTAFIGMDYDRGLTMLKEYVEDGTVSSKLDFKGYSDYPGCNYVGIKIDTSLEKMGESMKSDFEKLQGFMGDNKENVGEMPFSIYHKFDPVKGQASYTAGIPVKEFPGDVPTGMLTGSIPATRIYTLRHTGPYKYLGNAWSTLYTMQRNKEIKASKGLHPFETYVNSPVEVSENELITEINFVVKA